MEALGVNVDVQQKSWLSSIGNMWWRRVMGGSCQASCKGGILELRTKIIKLLNEVEME
jgi:hypothetical protein